MSEHAPIPYGRQWIDEDDIQAVINCLKGDWLTQGPTVSKFEDAVCKVTGAAECVAVSSGTAALHLAMLAADVKPGDIGLTSPITFVASSNAMLYCGGTVKFADIDPTTALIDPGAIERLGDNLADKGMPLKVIVPVDMSGHIANLPAIAELARRWGSFTIEDAAHSLGATYTFENKVYRAGCCAHTNAAILSFHPVKHITTAEGGAVLTNDSAFANKVRELRSHGIHRDVNRLTRPNEGAWYYEQDSLGYHYRLTDLQCALGISQIGKLESFLERRRDIAARYDAALQKAPLVECLHRLSTPNGQSSAYHLYVVRVIGTDIGDTSRRRRHLYDFLRERKIFAQIHYVPVTWQPYYQKHLGTQEADCPAANAYYASCLSLPMYPKLESKEQQRVIDALNDWARS